MKLGKMDSSPAQHRVRWIYLALALGTLAIFSSTLGHGFITFDDPEYVIANLHIQSGFSWDGLVYAFTTGDSSNWHPLTWLSYMLDYELYGLKPVGYHLTNLLFHTANTLLLFGVLRLMTRTVWRSALVAALFAWHPLHVESVAWIAERKDVLSTFFWLLTMIAYVRYVQKPDKRRYQFTLMLFACGLLAKPMVVTLPFVLLLLDFWPLKRISNSFLQLTPPENDPSKLTGSGIGRTRPLNKLFLEKIPFFALSLAASVITFMMQKKRGSPRPFGFYFCRSTRCQSPHFLYPLFEKNALANGPCHFLSISFLAHLAGCRSGFTFIGLFICSRCHVAAASLCSGWLVLVYWHLGASNWRHSSRRSIHG